MRTLAFLVTMATCIGLVVFGGYLVWWGIAHWTPDGPREAAMIAGSISLFGGSLATIFVSLLIADASDPVAAEEDDEEEKDPAVVDDDWLY